MDFGINLSLSVCHAADTLKDTHEKMRGITNTMTDDVYFYLSCVSAYMFTDDSNFNNIQQMKVEYERGCGIMFTAFDLMMKIPSL